MQKGEPGIVGVVSKHEPRGARWNRRLELVAVRQSIHHSAFFPSTRLSASRCLLLSIFVFPLPSVRLRRVFSCPLFLSCSIPPRLPLLSPLLRSLFASQGSCSNSTLILQPSSLPSLIPLYTLTGYIGSSVGPSTLHLLSSSPLCLSPIAIYSFPVLSFFHFLL